VSYLQEISDIYTKQINEGFRGMSYDPGTNKSYHGEIGKHSYKGSFPFNTGKKGYDNAYAYNAVSPPMVPTPISSDEEETVEEVRGTISKQKVVEYVNDLIDKASAEGMDFATFQLGQIKDFIIKN